MLSKTNDMKESDIGVDFKQEETGKEDQPSVEFKLLEFNRFHGKNTLTQSINISTTNHQQNRREK